MVRRRRHGGGQPRGHGGGHRRRRRPPVGADGAPQGLGRGRVRVPHQLRQPQGTRAHRQPPRRPALLLGAEGPAGADRGDGRADQRRGVRRLLRHPAPRGPDRRPCLPPEPGHRQTARCWTPGSRPLQAEFAGRPVPRPPWWGGVRVRPQCYEFWQNRDDRLHDRLRYRPVPAGGRSPASSPDLRPRSALWPRGRGNRREYVLGMADDDDPGGRSDRPAARRDRPAGARRWRSSGPASSTSAWPGSPSPRGTAGSTCRPTSSGRSTGGWAEAGATPPGAREFFGLTMAGPTVVTHGSDELRRRMLRPTFTGEESWCQLFSEPGCRLGPRRAGHPGRPRRRRVGDHRPEGVEHAGPHRRPGHAGGPDRSRGAQAQGPHLLRPGHARTRRRGAPVAPDDRRGRVQRGLPHRGAGPRRRPDRRCRRGVAGGHDHPVQRAHHHRRRQWPAGSGLGIDRRSRPHLAGRRSRDGTRSTGTGSPDCGSRPRCCA